MENDPLQEMEEETSNGDIDIKDELTFLDNIKEEKVFNEEVVTVDVQNGTNEASIKVEVSSEDDNIVEQKTSNGNDEELSGFHSVFIKEEIKLDTLREEEGEEDESSMSDIVTENYEEASSSGLSKMQPRPIREKNLASRKRSRTSFGDDVWQPSPEEEEMPMEEERLTDEDQEENATFNLATDGKAILNILQDSGADDELSETVKQCDELELVLNPPRDSRESDVDDAPSDVETDLAEMKDIGKGVLSQPVEVRGVKIRGSSRPVRTQINIGDLKCNEDGDYQPAAKKRLKVHPNGKQRTWEEFILEKDKRMPERFVENPACIQNFLDSRATPVDVVFKIFDDVILTKIYNETVKYGAQNGTVLQCSKEDILRYIAILLLSSYVELPNRESYWEKRADTYSELVAVAMPLSRFRDIHRFLHFNDNGNIDRNDQLYKIRPLIDHMNRKFSELIKPMGHSFSIGEAMEPYYGRHCMKQYIRGKRIRYGFKILCLTTPEGYLVRFVPNTGPDRTMEYKAPLEVRVVKKLIVGLVPKGSTIYIDSLLTSLPLIDAMTAKSVFVVGSMRADRVEMAPIEDLNKSETGSVHALREQGSNNVLVRWHDSRDIAIATNLRHEGVKGLTSCKRWSKTEKKEVTVPMPAIVSDYNKHAGGVDMFDKLRGQNRIGIRNRKWYWPLVRFMINGAIVNAWLIYRHIDNITLLEFTRQVVISILSGLRNPTGALPKRYSTVTPELRFDGKDHFVNGISKQRKCGICKVNTTFGCTKCNVGLHPKKCFLAYHKK